MNPITSFITRQALVIFFVFTFALEGVAVLFFASDPAVLPFALVLIPALAALTLAAVPRRGPRTEGRAGVKALLGRVVRWRVGPQWYAAVVGLPILGALATVGLAVLLGAPSANLFGKLTPDALAVVAIVVLPAFLEEIGWRGYALPKMLAGRSALAASLVLGALWASFHLPLFLPGQMYDGQSFWPLPVSIIATSIILTWIFVNTKGSVLMVALFHAALNGTVPLTWGVDPVQVWELRAAVLTVIALFIIAIAGPDLTREKRMQVQQARQAAVIVEPAAKV